MVHSGFYKYQRRSVGGKRDSCLQEQHVGGGDADRGSDFSDRNQPSRRRVARDQGWARSRKGNPGIPTPPYAIQLVSDPEHAGFQYVHSDHTDARVSQETLFRSCGGYTFNGGNLWHRGLVTLA
ncbi:hypothetical protein Dsin_028743 [Dipteronia sinensis]|uniref:Uncharacterized protein n=1 Tax=Dipteronia sinensis TaxID=43782 RepID=A0AAD9ZRD3_9ROSI|nr:hypothetical protein Dsin_028743 [Dipteronia sinensis]